MAPVAGSRIAACTNADCAEFDWLQGPMVGSVAVSSYGVARPAALSGFCGTINVQLVLGSGGSVGRPAAWAAAACMRALSRSVVLGLVCACAIEASSAVIPNTAARAAPLRIQHSNIVRSLLLRVGVKPYDIRIRI